MISMFVYLLSLVWLLGLGLFGEREDKLLEKVMSAPERVEFHGVWQKSFRYRGEWFETEQEIWHRRPNRTKILFLRPEKVRGAVLIREGTRVVFLPAAGGKGVRHTRRYAGGFFGEDVNTRRLDVLVKNYEVISGDSGVILGRRAVEVRIVPRYAHRSRLTLWIDEETGLVLKMQKYGPDGDLASQAKFTELTFGLPADFDIDVRSDGRESSTDSRQVEVFADLESFLSEKRAAFYLPKAVPPGFVLDRIRAIRKEGREVYHFMYTDGLGWISLFERAKAETDERERARADTVEQKGTIMVLHGEVGDVGYALVGEVTVDELETMKASLQLVGAEESGQRTSIGRLALIWIPVVLVLAIFLILRSKREA